MANSDYIPDDDDDFDTFFTTQFCPYVAAHFAALGLSAADNTALQAQKTLWGYAWPGFTNVRAAFHAGTQDKDTVRGSSEVQVRYVSNKVQANPAVTNAQKEALGITVRKTTRTPVAVPSTSPAMQKIDTSSRGILRLFYGDSATPETRAKPAGVAFAEIRIAIAPAVPPTDPLEMDFLANETRAPYRADFEIEEIGKTCYFALRWLNTRGEAGPWSPFYSAVVPS
jgi:hypothetical protein